MTDFLYPLALLIGFWYARKYGREAVVKINQYHTEKENQNKKP